MNRPTHRRKWVAAWVVIASIAVGGCNTDAPSAPVAKTIATDELRAGRDYIFAHPMDAKDLERVAGRAIREVAAKRFPSNTPNNVAASETDNRGWTAMTHVHLDGRR